MVPESLSRDGTHAGSEWWRLKRDVAGFNQQLACQANPSTRTLEETIDPAIEGPVFQENGQGEIL